MQAEGDRLTAERIMLHKTRADMAAQLARLKAIQVGSSPCFECARMNIYKVALEFMAPAGWLHALMTHRPG